ncbi:MAG: pyridoxal-phosphate-dependent aminotransferase family protein [Planctomycetota bacterium]
MELRRPKRILMGPGPSNCHPCVLKAMAEPLLGHLDPEFLEIMDRTQDRLRRVMKTDNRLTLPISGTGSAGMEACLCNLVEPGDRVLVCINGVFGTRMADIVKRLGGELHTLEAEWGKPFQPEAVREAVAECDPAVVAVVHAETSTGVLQPLEEFSRIVHGAGALLLVDAVTSLGGCEVEADGWQIDALYSGTQKCLSCPPGLAPASFSDRAVDRIDAREKPVPSWYLDMSMVRNYWGSERTYHHTAPISMIYALDQALKVILDEGLEARFERHRVHHRALVAGLEGMGLSMLVAPQFRLPMLNAVRIPESVEDIAVREALLGEHHIEIGGGLGPLAGRVWRIGLMGHSCTRENVMRLLRALEGILKAEGAPVRTGAAEAAEEVYDQQ